MINDKLKNVQPTTKFNWCPGIRILYFIPARNAIALDEKGAFEDFLIGRFDEGLGLIGEHISLCP
jgi:hypothetical protein